jgi:hypothetical protein
VLFSGDHHCLVEADADPKWTIMRAGFGRQCIRIGGKFDIPAAAHTATVDGFIGKKGIPAGMQDIKGTTTGTGDLPRGYPIIAFAGRVQSDIYIIALFIEEAKITDGAGIDVEVFYVGSLQVFIAARESDILQQLIKYGKLLLIFFTAVGIFSGCYKQGTGGDAFFLLEKWELRMIAQLLREETGACVLIEFE